MFPADRSARAQSRPARRRPSHRGGEPGARTSGGDIGGRADAGALCRPAAPRTSRLRAAAVNGLNRLAARGKLPGRWISCAASGSQRCCRHSGPCDALSCAKAWRRISSTPRIDAGDVPAGTPNKKDGAQPPAGRSRRGGRRASPSPRFTPVAMGMNSAFFGNGGEAASALESSFSAFDALLARGDEIPPGCSLRPLQRGSAEERIRRQSLSSLDRDAVAGGGRSAAAGLRTDLRLISSDLYHRRHRRRALHGESPSSSGAERATAIFDLGIEPRREACDRRASCRTRAPR